MWIKKTPIEIRNLELYKLKIFFIYFVFIFFVFFFGDKINGDNLRFSPGSGTPLKWNEVIERIPVYLFISLILTFIGSKLDSISKKKKKDRYICYKCNNYKKEEKDDLCECGGRFIEIDKMKWIDNNDDQTH